MSPHISRLIALAAVVLLLVACDDEGGDGNGTADTASDTSTGGDTTTADSSNDTTTSGDTTDDTSPTDTSTDVADTSMPDTTTADTADTSTDTSDDTTTADSTDAADTTPGDMADTDMMMMSDTIAESPDPDLEFPDCISGCAHDGPAFTVPWDRYTSIVGVIDDGCHMLPGAPQAADVDIIEITAEARTLLEIEVVPTAGSVVDPLVTTSDGLALLTYNDEGGLGGNGARTVLAAPYLNNLPFYLFVEHAPNYFAFDPNGTCAMYTGGSDHEYEITIHELPFAPIELGDLQPGGSASDTGTLAANGDIVYVRFSAPATASPVITITRTGNAALTPTVAGMNTIGGQLVWNAAKIATGASVTLNANDFDVCNANCDGVTGEFVFAIVDFDGLGGSDYTFSVEVEL